MPRPRESAVRSPLGVIVAAGHPRLAVRRRVHLRGFGASASRSRRSSWAVAVVHRSLRRLLGRRCMCGRVRLARPRGGRRPTASPTPPSGCPSPARPAPSRPAALRLLHSARAAAMSTLPRLRVVIDHASPAVAVPIGATAAPRSCSRRRARSGRLGTAPSSACRRTTRRGVVGEDSRQGFGPGVTVPVDGIVERRRRHRGRTRLARRAAGCSGSARWTPWLSSETGEQRGTRGTARAKKTAEQLQTLCSSTI